MKLFQFQPQKSTLTAFAAGTAIVLLSIAMTLGNNSQMETFIHIILRDFLMIYVIGFCFPILYLRASGQPVFESLGITGNRLKTSLLLNIVFAILLLFQFSFSGGGTIGFSYKALFAISYILAAGIFEMVCIYGFLRYCFEKAFGVIPAIFLTALFYSLHHAGFQPEFLKLFFVGTMYCTVFYITRNIFIIFPFFWGVGAVWDVLINSSAGQPLQNLTSFIVSLVLIAAMAIFVFCERKISKRVTG